LILDLSRLEFIDSTGYGGSQMRRRSAAGRIHDRLIHGPPAVQRVFELTDTRTHLPFIDA